MDMDPSSSSGTQPVRLLSMAEFDTFIEEPKQQAMQLPDTYALSSRFDHPLVAATFNNECQLRGIHPQFTFVPSDQGFSASVVCGSLGEISLPQAFPSKKAAKENLCAHALPQLRELPTLAAKSKGTGAANPFKNSDQTSIVLCEENWLQILDGFGVKQSDFALYAADTKEQFKQGLCTGDIMFCCTLRLPRFPDKTFGSSTQLFPSKAAARRNAAKAAVLFLRSTGATNGGSSIASSYAQRVAQIASEIGLSLPEFVVLDASPPLQGIQTGGWRNMYAQFPPKDAAKDIRLSGEVGRVGPLLGKKAAKVECCKSVLRILEKIKDEQISMQASLQGTAQLCIS